MILRDGVTPKNTQPPSVFRKAHPEHIPGINSPVVFFTSNTRLSSLRIISSISLNIKPFIRQTNSQYNRKDTYNSGNIIQIPYNIEYPCNILLWRTRICSHHIRNDIRSVGVMHSKCASGYAVVNEAGATTRLPSFLLISNPVIMPSSISMRSTSFFCCVRQK